VKFEFLNLTGSLNFVSQPIVLNFAGNNRVTVPFTFSGEINGVTPNTSTPIFTAILSGQGFAVFEFWNTSLDPSNPHYLLYSIEYHFEPVPILIDIKPRHVPKQHQSQQQRKDSGGHSVYWYLRCGLRRSHNRTLWRCRR
jgi:hypothetical protein